MIFQRTATGLVRENNQDSIFACPTLCAVADGMGGHLAGEVASLVAIQAISQFQNTRPNLSEIDTVFQAVNRAIFEKQQQHSELSGMGTTLTAVWFIKNTIRMGHVGDSRCYILRGGELIQLTQDHSYVGRMLRDKLLTEEQARVSPYRHYIDRALGLEQSVKVDCLQYTIRKSDLLLLCSDGLSSMLPKQDICDILLQNRGEKALEILFQKVEQAGANDNISVILCDPREVR